jgi:UDP-2-acetamido-3-amino-2,3-dideoxy-glucuronate N-acetyltransferase
VARAGSCHCLPRGAESWNHASRVYGEILEAGRFELAESWSHANLADQSPVPGGDTVMGLDPSVYVHPSGLCQSDQVGPHTRVWAFAHVLPGAEVGADCNICDHAFIEGGAKLGDRVTVKNAVLVWDRVTIEDDVFLGPNMVFTNVLRPRAGLPTPREAMLPTLVRRGATIGANATVVCGVTIGESAFVAAGAVVAADVPAHALVAGNPAHRRGWVCACGQQLDSDLACACGRRYRLGGDDEAAGLASATGSSSDRLAELS